MFLLQISKLVVNKRPIVVVLEIWAPHQLHITRQDLLEMKISRLHPNVLTQKAWDSVIICVLKALQENLTYAKV